MNKSCALKISLDFMKCLCPCQANECLSISPCVQSKKLYQKQANEEGNSMYLYQRKTVIRGRDRDKEF